MTGGFAAEAAVDLTGGIRQLIDMSRLRNMDNSRFYKLIEVLHLYGAFIRSVPLTQLRGFFRPSIFPSLLQLFSFAIQRYCRPRFAAEPCLHRYQSGGCENSSRRLFQAWRATQFDPAQEPPRTRSTRTGSQRMEGRLGRQVSTPT